MSHHLNRLLRASSTLLNKSVFEWVLTVKCMLLSCKVYYTHWMSFFLMFLFWMFFFLKTHTWFCSTCHFFPELLQVKQCHPIVNFWELSRWYFHFYFKTQSHKNIPSTVNDKLRGHCSCPHSNSTGSNCSTQHSVLLLVHQSQKVYLWQKQRRKVLLDPEGARLLTYSPMSLR